MLEVEKHMALTFPVRNPAGKTKFNLVVSVAGIFIKCINQIKTKLIYYHQKFFLIYERNMFLKCKYGITIIFKGQRHEENSFFETKQEIYEKRGVYNRGMTSQTHD